MEPAMGNHAMKTNTATERSALLPHKSNRVVEAEGAQFGVAVVESLDAARGDEYNHDVEAQIVTLSPTRNLSNSNSELDDEIEKELRHAEVDIQRLHETSLMHSLAARHFASQQIHFNSLHKWNYVVPKTVNKIVCVIAALSFVLGLVMKRIVMLGGGIIGCLVCFVIDLFLKEEYNLYWFDNWAFEHRCTSAQFEGLHRELSDCVEKSRIRLRTTKHIQDTRAVSILDKVGKNVKTIQSRAKEGLRRSHTIPPEVKHAFKCLRVEVKEYMNPARQRVLREKLGPEYSHIVIFKAQNKLKESIENSTRFPVDATIQYLEQKYACKD